MDGPAKLFVYGALMSGEPLSSEMSGAVLLRALRVRGTLYDTGYGYPAAVFGTAPGEGYVHGELYLLDDPDVALRRLDLVEETGRGLYRRRLLDSGGERFYAYEAHGLARTLSSRLAIRSGNWRTHGSLARRSPHRFAVLFDKAHFPRVQSPPPHGSDPHIHLEGTVPVLVTAPHATRHRRGGAAKRHDRHTAALAVAAHALTGCHALYTHWATAADPNYYDDVPFKRAVAEIVGAHGIAFVVDIHGTGPGVERDVHPGFGEAREFLLGCERAAAVLEESFSAAGIKVGSEHLYRAARQQTVAKFAARRLGVRAMQLEIGWRLRDPAHRPADFDAAAFSLARLVAGLARIPPERA